MGKLKAAWIGFNDPNQLADRETIFASYEKYAKMGFAGMDGDLSTLPGDRDENFKRFTALGLRCLGTWIGEIQSLINEPEQVKRIVEICHYYGINGATIGGSSVISSFWEGYGQNGSYDSMMRDIEAMNRLVTLFHVEGLTCLYHNHYQEFTTYYHGVSVMDYILTQVDPRLQLKLDAGWVYVGGLDPVEYMEKVKDRIGMLHVKDFTEMIQPRYFQVADTETDFGFTSIGSGRLDIKGVLSKAGEIGIEYAIAEQDRMRHLNPADSLLCAYLNMRETGCIE